MSLTERIAGRKPQVAVWKSWILEMLAEILPNLADQCFACLNASLPPLDVDAAILSVRLSDGCYLPKSTRYFLQFRSDTFVAATTTIDNVA